MENSVYNDLMAEWELWKRGKLRYMTRRHAQRRLYDFINQSKEKINILNCHRRLGKAQPLSSLVLTPSGWQTMGEIEVGSIVTIPSGGQARVLDVFPQGEKDIYTITFHDGSKADCCLEHLWKCSYSEGRSPYTTHHNVRWERPTEHVINTQQLISLIEQFKQPGQKGRGGITIPLVCPIIKPEAQLPMDPYLLGVLLGDGCLRGKTPKLTTNDAHIVQSVSRLLPQGIIINKIQSAIIDYSIIGHKGSKNQVTEVLKQLGVWGHKSYTKFIPEIYKNSSIEQRINLIRGLMDTDGTMCGHQISYTTTSYQLALDVREIILSLGGLATFYERHPKGGRVAWDVNITFPYPKQLFTLPRKKDKCPELYRNGQRPPNRRIVSIEYSGKQEAKCIVIDHPEQLYITNDYIVTHNSFLMGLLCVERCTSIPGQIVKYGAPTFKQCTSIVRPIINLILSQCPPSMYPEHSGHTWVWKNGSELQVIGCNIDNGDRLRGQATDMAVLDEVREIPNLRYIIEDVLSWQFVKRTNPKLIMATTPPKTMDHEFIQLYVPQALNKGSYVEIPVTHNKDWSKEDEDMILDEFGINSKESATWLREAMCRFIPDDKALVVPEFNDENIGIQQRPEWFFPYVAIDLGWKDQSAALFGYVDFAKQKLIIEDEVVVVNKNTRQISKLFSDKEISLWANYKGLKDLDRVGDTTQQQRHDLDEIYRYFVREVDKYDKDEAIASLRTAIADRKIIISPKCTNLIFQLKNGIWNDRRTDFERTEKSGHLDAVMALVYGNRMANWRTMPGPNFNRSKGLEKLTEDWSKEVE